MPLYLCNSRKGLISNQQKDRVAKDITKIHCRVTGAPPTFVHVFFFEEATRIPLGEYKTLLYGQIRAGRTDTQKEELVECMNEAINRHTGILSENIAVYTKDVPSSWVMEGGELLPEPGEEEAWLAAHEAKVNTKR